MILHKIDENAVEYLLRFDEAWCGDLLEDHGAACAVFLLNETDNMFFTDPQNAEYARCRGFDKGQFCHVLQHT